jgi:4-hydroxy-tetrahydrodipicolinate synthase
MNINTDFPNGMWPVMLTPYTENGKIDYKALEKLIHWYIENGADGLFAVCQSSEMFFLSLEERIELARFIKKESSIPVIASGHISDDFQMQMTELNKMAETGVDALILISNRLAKSDETDEVLIHRLDTLISKLPVEMPLGFYECPYPYKRLLSPEVTRYCANTGRFYFIKDTSCDADNMKEKLKIVKGTQLKLYNANTATLLESLKLGAAGYSGVMANFHPKLYKWLLENYNSSPKEVESIQAVLTMCSLIEHSNYPVNAKYCMKLYGNGFTLVSRKPGASPMTYAQKAEVSQLIQLTKELEEKIK